MVEANILGVQLDPSSGVSVVVLGKPDDETRVLPIFIGQFEAQAIAIGLSDLTPPRPGTHDLLLATLTSLECRLDHVAITALRDGTFFAELELTTPSGSSRVSARPSDAIALAVRAEANISIADDVLEVAGVDVEYEAGRPLDDDAIDEIVGEFQAFLESAEPDDFSTGLTSDDEFDPDDE